MARRLAQNIIGGCSQRLACAWEYTFEKLPDRKTQWTRGISMSGVLSPGDQVPDFRLKSLDGSDVSLSDYRGGRLLIFCWGSW